MAVVDAAAATLIPEARLLAAAGAAVARAVRRRFRPCCTLVLAGPGNNGGDGLVAARALEQAGWPVAVAIRAPPRPGSAAAAAAAWRGPTVPFSTAEVGRAALIIDAIFGAGLTRPVEGLAAEVLRAAAAPIVAIDVPSGVDGRTGAIRGHAQPAALTVTFVRRKPGHLLRPGRDLCGPVVLADIGLPDAALRAVQPTHWHNGPGLWRLPRPGPATHKYDRGHVTVLAGGMAGAARLAAGAAHRAGAGLVTIAAADPAPHHGGDPGVIVTTEPIPTLLADPRRTAWVIGPGLPPDATTRAAVRTVVAAGRAVVADAGALTAAANTPEALLGCAVLTPHAGEFARVFGDPGEDRVAAVRAAAARTRAVVLLKGADTIIAAPDGRVAINAHAPPDLATGGTGDVLAGVIAGLLAQGLSGFDAAAAAAWLQGEAAYQVGPGLVAADLIPRLPAAMQAAARGSVRRVY